MNKPKLVLLVIAILLIAGQSAQSQHWLYSFRPGDTLWDLCREYTTVPNCWQTIGAANGVEFPRRIPPGTIIKFPIQWLKAIPEPVTITFVRGAVSYQLAASQQVIPAAAGTRLPIGSTVRVGADSSATLVFANQSVLVLDANSELILDALSSGGETGMVDSRLRLLRGASTSHVPNEDDGRIRFQIETPAAVAAVRGTEFRVTTVEGDSDSMRAEVLEGLVAVANTVDQQNVNQGFGLVASSNAPVPAPVALLPAPIINTDSTPQVATLTLTWQALAGAQSYRVELYSDQAEAEKLASNQVTATTFSWTGFPDACYQMTVSGIDNQSLQGLPQRTRVCLVPALAVVNLQEDGIEQVDDNILRASWEAVAMAASYELEIATDAQFQSIVSRIQTTDLHADFQFEDQSTYFMRVRAISADGVRGDTGSMASWSPSTWDRHVTGIATILVLIALF